MEDGGTQSPKTAAVLERWRREKGLSKQRLAELSDVSATYVRTIEAGFDDDDRPVVPSAGVIQKLARGLASAEPDETGRADVERRAYAELMAAAGYLDPGAFGLGPVATGGPASAPPPSAEPAREPDSGAVPTVSRSVQSASPPLLRSAPVAPAPTPAPASPNGPVLVALRDRRLHRHCRELLESWDALTSEDQSLVLGIMEFVAERRRRRECLS